MFMTYCFKKFRDLAYAAWLARTRLGALQRLSPEQLANHQHTRLRQLVKFAMENSKFYAQRFAGIDWKTVAFSELPVLTKADMMSHYDDLVTAPGLRLSDIQAHLDVLKKDDYFRGRYKAFRSAGSTGKPAVMIYHWTEFALVLAQVLRSAGATVERPFRRLRGANFYARTPTHDSIRISQSFQVGIHDVRDFPVDMPLAQITAELNQFQPNVLSGYPSAITEMAHASLRGELRISPSSIFLGSEPLTPKMRETIRHAFGVDPFDQYGTTEAIVMASECPQHQGLHLHEDVHHIEILDSHGRAVGPGEIGHKVVVTNLYAFTQPILRYEVSDMVLLSPDSAPCPCGNPYRRIQRVIGRNEDVLRLQNRERAQALISPEDLRAAIDGCPSIRQFQVVRDGDTLRIRTILVDAQQRQLAHSNLMTAIQRLLQSRGVEGVKVEAEFVDELDRDPLASQKFRQIVAQPRR